MVAVSPGPIRQGPSRIARSVFLACVGSYLLVAAWLVWRTAILEPYSDMFDWVERYFRLQSDGDVLRFLWAPHNVHHMVWMFLILDLDISMFGARSGVFLAAGVAGLAATAAMLAWSAAKAAAPSLRAVAAGGALALSAMGCHVLDASADINTTYVHALVFSVAAILLAGSGRSGGWRSAGALALAAAAGLGNASGLAVWPALLLGGLLRRDWRWSAVVAIAGLSYGLAYLVGEPSTLAGAVPPVRPMAMAELFLTYLGLPWSRGLAPIGWLLGAVALGASAAVAAAAISRGASAPLKTSAALIGFSLATACLAALGRGGLIRPDQPPVRYAVFLIPLHAGLWIAAQPALAQAWARRPRTMNTALLAGAAFLLVHQALMADYAIRTSDAVRLALAQFHAGRTSPAMLTRVYPDLAKAQAISARLRREGLYQDELRPTPAS